MIEPEKNEPLTGDDVGYVLDDLMAVWRRAKAEYGPDDPVTKLLDEASGPLDAATDALYEREREADG